MTTKSIEQLQIQIEQLVREHLVAHRSAATAAVERAFASVMAASARASPSARPSPSAPRSKGRRRPPAELAVLAEQLYAAVCANPGELMTAIATYVGKTADSLHYPMQHLKRAGRVRGAGQRGFTRYFPMTSSK